MAGVRVVAVFGVAIPDVEGACVGSSCRSRPFASSGRRRFAACVPQQDGTAGGTELPPRTTLGDEAGTTRPGFGVAP